MPTKKEVQDESDFHSSRISETSRYVGFGLLATYYAAKVDPSDSFGTETCLVTAIGFSGAFAVLLDYSQYVFGYLQARAALRDQPHHRYHQGVAAVWFPLKMLSFVTKQVAAVAGSIGVIMLVLSA